MKNILFTLALLITTNTYSQSINKTNDGYTEVVEVELTKQQIHQKLNEYGFALRLGHVDFGEDYSKDKTMIVHSIKKSEGLYSHNVFYFSPSMAEFFNAKNESDF